MVHLFTKNAIATCWIAVFMLLAADLFSQTTYTFTGSGAWTDINRWTPSYPGTTIVFGDQAIIAAGATCTNMDELDLVIAGTLTVETGAMVTFPSSGGNSLDCTGSLSVQGTIEGPGIACTIQAGASVSIGAGGNLNLLDYSSLTNEGDFQIASGGGLILGFGSWLTNSGAGASITNGGVVDLMFLLTNQTNATITNNGTFTTDVVENSANFTNSSGATLNIRPYVSWNNNSGGMMTNSGTMIIDVFCTLTNYGTLTNDGILTNYSTLTNSGTLTNSSTLTNNGTLTNSGTVNNNGTYDGSGGTFSGSLFSNPSGGTVALGASPGCLAFSDGFTNAGTLTIEINGADPCTDYDQVNVTGAVVLGGTLNVTWGFTPTAGQSFTIMTFGGRTGIFATANVPSVNGINFL
ncbi:MAG: hypothetical protein IPN76_15170 [Saprospiraceae bacterium]|nr:hypothetical protein [Saprospiraceae bacterium]